MGRIFRCFDNYWRGLINKKACDTIKERKFRQYKVFLIFKEMHNLKLKPIDIVSKTLILIMLGEC